YEDTVDHADRIQSADTIASGYDTDVENVFPEQSAQDAGGLSPWTERGGAVGEEAPDLDQFVAARPSLSDHLAEQIGHILHDPRARLIGRFLIDSLSETGYLTVDLETVAQQLGADVDQVEEVLDQVQGCDP